MQFRVGVVVLGVFLIAGFMTLLFNHFQVKSYTVYIDFASANGIAPGTPIKSSGVLIGRVEAVTLQTDKPDQPVRVTAEIDSKYKIRHDQTLQLSSGLLGDSELDVVNLPAKPQPPPPVVEPSTQPKTPVRPTTSGEPSLRVITVARICRSFRHRRQLPADAGPARGNHPRHRRRHARSGIRQARIRHEQGEHVAFRRQRRSTAVGPQHQRNARQRRFRPAQAIGRQNRGIDGCHAADAERRRQNRRRSANAVEYEEEPQRPAGNAASNAAIVRLDSKDGQSGGSRI